MDIEVAARLIAACAHESIGQVRKGGYLPYYHHPFKVAKDVKEFGGSGPLVAAAFLHDVVEDTPFTFSQLDNLLHEAGCYTAEITETLGYVNALTDYFDTDVRVSRTIRKVAECLRHVREETYSDFWLIKHADIYDNLKSIETLDKNFFPIYLGETWLLVKYTPEKYRDSELYKNLLSRYQTLAKEIPFTENRHAILREEIFKELSERVVGIPDIRDILAYRKWRKDNGKSVR